MFDQYDTAMLVSSNSDQAVHAQHTLIVYNGSQEEGEEDAEPADCRGIVESFAEDAGVGGCNGSMDGVGNGGRRGIERLHY